MKHEELVSRRDAIIDADDMTVTTTDSDRRYAAAVMNRVMEAKHSQFLSITKGLNAENQKAEAERLRTKKKLPKQVDVTWLQRKNQLIPTSEDLAVLTSPEPLVAFVCDVESASRHLNSNTGATKKAVHSASSTVNAFHMQSAVENNQVLPSFSMHVPSESVFGSVHGAQMEFASQVQSQQRQPGQWDSTLSEDFHRRYEGSGFF